MTPPRKDGKDGRDGKDGKDGTDGNDWMLWHEPYADPDSSLSRRLRLVQEHIGRWLDERPEQTLTALSVCAGQGHDLLGVLAARTDASRVCATLLEYDEGNVAMAQAVADRAGLAGVRIVRADAGNPTSYLGVVPADLVLMVGVFGNISDDDVQRTIDVLPQLCARGATTIWSRTRRAPDLTPAIRGWLQAAGFVEEAFDAPDGVLFSVGVHRFVGAPATLSEQNPFFRFVG